MTCRRTLTGAGWAKRGARQRRAPRIHRGIGARQRRAPRIHRAVLAAVVALVAFAPLLLHTSTLLSASVSSAVNQLAADAVGAGNRPDATGSGSSTVSVSWSASTMVSGSAVDGYIVKRYPQAGGAAVLAGGTCSGLVIPVTCSDTSVPTGAWSYAVVPYRAGWLGSESLLSAAVIVGRYATVLFPANGGSYTRTEWATVHGTCAASTICGTAGTDNGTVTQVAISLRNDTTGECWDGGAKFNQVCPNYVVTTGTTQWSRSVPAGRLDVANTYTLTVRITDGGGTTTIAGPTFTITG